MFKTLKKILSRSTEHLNDEVPKLDFVLLETTTRCNLRCLQCNDVEKPQDLSWDNFLKILPILERYKPLVQLNGHGETLLHSRFMDMLEAVVEVGCNVQFQTNAMLLTSKIVERCVKVGVKHIQTSLDAATPELFGQIRNLANLDVVISNLRVISEMKTRYNASSPTLGVSFLAMRHNIHELPAVIRLANELGAVNVGVGELVEYEQTRDKINTTGYSLKNDPIMAEWAQKAEVEAERCGILLSLPPNIPGRLTRDGSDSCLVIDPMNPMTYKGYCKVCNWPWSSIFVRLDGSVRPCCVIKEVYGNLLNQSFESIWRADKYRKLRSKVSSDNPPDACVTCYTAPWRKLKSEN